MRDHHHVQVLVFDGGEVSVEGGEEGGDPRIHIEAALAVRKPGGGREGGREGEREGRMCERGGVRRGRRSAHFLFRSLSRLSVLPPALPPSRGKVPPPTYL